jgi:hypothetical protein
MVHQNDTAVVGPPSPCERIPDATRLGICIFLNALTVAIAVYFVVFFFFPHKIVFVGTGVAAASGIFWYVFNSLSRYGQRILAARDFYIRGILFYPCWALGVSMLLVLAAGLGTAVMFDTIVNRFNYLRALDRAIPFFEADQVGVPAPKDLAEAFALNPQRPEVPFILMRSARLLTFDDRYENFYLYMEQFLDALDREAVIKRSENFRPQYKLAQGGEAPELPLLDPIRLLAGYMVEVSEPKRKQAYADAIGLLQKHRNREGDDAAKLQRSIYETDRDLEITPDPDPARQSAIAEAAIQRLEQQIDPSKRPATKDTFRSAAFAADHVYQQALDSLAYLKAMQFIPAAAGSNACRQDAKRTDAAANGQATPNSVQPDPEAKRIDEVVAFYQRILTIRSRLMSQTEVVWWQTPGKLTLYYMFSEFSDKHGVNGARLLTEFGRCPALLERMKKLHAAAAFKPFQDPETWAHGTPLSRSFNGSATAAQLRRWMQQGWNWKP